VVFRVAALVFCSGVLVCFDSVGSSGSLMRGLSDVGVDPLSNRARSVTSFPLPSPGDVVLCSSNQARSSSSGAKSGRGDLSKGNGE